MHVEHLHSGELFQHRSWGKSTGQRFESSLERDLQAVGKVSKRQFSENMHQYHENEERPVTDLAPKRDRNREIVRRRTKR